MIKKKEKKKLLKTNVRMSLQQKRNKDLRMHCGPCGELSSFSSRSALLKYLKIGRMVPMANSSYINKEVCSCTKKQNFEGYTVVS